MGWTIAGHQHLLVVSLGIGRRAVPIYWRAYDASVLQGSVRWTLTLLAGKLVELDLVDTINTECVRTTRKKNALKP